MGAGSDGMMGIFPPEGGLKRVGERFAGGLVLIIGALLMIVTRELDKGVGDRVPRKPRKQS